MLISFRGYIAIRVIEYRIFFKTTYRSLSEEINSNVVDSDCRIYMYTIHTISQKVIHNEVKSHFGLSRLKINSLAQVKYDCYCDVKTFTDIKLQLC